MAGLLGENLFHELALEEGQEDRGDIDGFAGRDLMLDASDPEAAQ
ncbi:hypothetical protein [Herbaspirillum huttiense]|uniref:Uncharacterized protein n=2 Tax=Herbaspirillum huttiense TaxID=863372 RepID=A0AAJ2LS93_9BURK|nr:hypothetical protein [Herbaspirillum huttiense]MDR9834905.1 hypothetical protein [Herbaspirillum huttiense]